MSLLKRGLSLAVSLAVLTGILLAVLNAQNILDWWRLRGYQPPARIAELAAHIEMTDYGQRLFYVHRPKLSNRDTFAANCPGTEHTIVLGCYITHQSIYIFDVEDDRLDGIEEVTAAHEMLHAAYDRLKTRDREKVDAQLLEFFEGLDNSRIKQTIQAYEERDPSVVANELHSIIGTEVRELPDELEVYYSKYFSNRRLVVGYSEQYEAIFSEQQNKLEKIASEIESLESQLISSRESIDAREASLQAEAAHLSQLRASNDIEEYNAAVPGYNAQVGEYRAKVEEYNATVRRYNNLVNQYNEMAIAQKELYKAIDSRPQTL